MQAWRVAHGRLATKSNLQKRGVVLLSLSCPLCGEEDETEEHVFINCTVARSVLHDFGKWWNIDINRISNLPSLFEWGNTLNLKGSKLKIFTTALFTYLWQIWKLRKDKIFQGVNREGEILIFSQIQALSYYWVRHRAVSCNLANRWVEWCNSPCTCY